MRDQAPAPRKRRAERFGLGCARSLLRHYPSSSPRVSLLRRLPPVPEAHRPFRVKGGLRIGACYSADYVSKSLFWLGDFEPWVLAAMRRHIVRGGTVLDVGANIGAMTIRFARWVGQAGRVLALEPYPPSAARLRRNLEVNGLGNVTLLECAASSRAGTLEVGLRDDDPSHACVRPPAAGPDAGAGRTWTVACATVDEIVDSAGGPWICAAKIDVEGHEEEVLAGMTRLLSGGRVGALVFERHLAHDARRDGTIESLQAMGYRVFRIHKRLLGFRLLPFGTRGRRPTDDFVALPAAASG